MNVFLNIKLIARNWWRNKLFFLISLFSLTAGLGCTNLLMTFFIHEYNVEKYNTDRNLIYLLRQDSPMEEGIKVAYSTSDAATQIKEKYAEITDILRVNGMSGNLCKTLSKILCKWKQDSAVSLFLYLDSVFKNKHKLIHNQAPVMNRLCPFLLNLHK